MFKIIDHEGGGLMKGETFSTLEECRERLASFHSIDVEHTERLTLLDLCEIGGWGIENEKGQEVAV